MGQENVTNRKLSSGKTVQFHDKGKGKRSKFIGDLTSSPYLTYRLKNSKTSKHHMTLFPNNPPFHKHHTHPPKNNNPIYNENYPICTRLTLLKH